MRKVLTECSRSDWREFLSVMRWKSGSWKLILFFFPWFHIKIRLTYNSLLASDNDFLPSFGNITVLFRSTLTWTIILHVQLLFLVANQLFYIGLYVYVDKICDFFQRVHIVYFWVTQLTYIFQHHFQSVPLQTWTHKRFGSDPALQVKSVGDMTSI